MFSGKLTQSRSSFENAKTLDILLEQLPFLNEKFYNLKNFFDLGKTAFFGDWIQSLAAMLHVDSAEQWEVSAGTSEEFLHLFLSNRSDLFWENKKQKWNIYLIKRQENI